MSCVMSAFSRVISDDSGLPFWNCVFLCIWTVFFPRATTFGITTWILILLLIGFLSLLDFLEILTSGWTTTYHFGCVVPDYSTNPEPMRMLSFFWWTIILKLMELCETVFFILRRKESQASFLHVYHHVSTLIIIWVGTKYVGGGITSFSPLINNAVHVIMYTYYLLSAEGSPGVKRILNRYKMWLTVLQMVQFTIMLLYSSQIFLPSCKAPMGVTPLYFPNVIFVYYMFYDFFKKNYSKTTKESLNRVKNGNGVKKE